MGTLQFINVAGALLPDSYQHRDGAALKQPFHYPTEGRRPLAWNACVAMLGLAGTLFALSTWIWASGV